MEKVNTNYNQKDFIDNVSYYGFYLNAFSEEECETIIKSYDVENEMLNGLVGKNKKPTEERKSKIKWIEKNQESEWIYNRLNKIVKEVNDSFFNFHILGILESLQFTKYFEPDGKYEKHVDSVKFAYTRKISLTIQLSDPDSYEGGDLIIHCQSPGVLGRKEHGCLTAFPSYMLHEVTPVTKGTRYSLVAWITGNNFK